MDPVGGRTDQPSEKDWLNSEPQIIYGKIRFGQIYLYYLGFFNQFAQSPCLGFGQGATLFDDNQIAFMAFIGLIVDVIFLGPDQYFSIERMGYSPLDKHRSGFAHEVAYNTTGQSPMALYFVFDLGFAHFDDTFSRIIVLTRAISRRTFPN